VLLITSPAGDEGTDYLVDLERWPRELGVDLRYAADRFRPDLDGCRAVRRTRWPTPTSLPT
jgi:hypothetical protein